MADHHQTNREPSGARPTDGGDECAGSSPSVAWNFSETAPPAFRNQVWRILGMSRKRDVLLAVRQLAGSEEPLAQVDIASEAATFPHFHDATGKPDLSDNGDLEPLKQILTLVAVPRVARPQFEYLCPFEPMCEFAVNPYHVPTDDRVRAAIEYVSANRDSQTATDRGGTDELPIDPFSAEAYTYVRLSRQIECEAPSVRFSTFRPHDFGAHHATGFDITGEITADELTTPAGVTDSQLKNALQDIFTEFVDQAGHGKNHFRIGLYSPNEGETERDVRRRAIQEHATFQTIDFDLRGGRITFEWELEPILV
jgi:hypothetical protein